MNKKQTIPLYIISGFLGSGKTTLLLHILKECEQKNLRPAIILNELGEENVEGDDFHNQQLISLLNGCICCTIQEDLTRELHHFLTTSSVTPDLIIIEGTGVANPLEIVEAVTQPILINKVELNSIISLIDASRYLEYQSIFSSSKEIRTILKDQLIHASLLILNKIDLLSTKELHKVRQKIEKVLPLPIPMLESKKAEVPMDQILINRIGMQGINSFSSNKDKQHPHHDHNEPELSKVQKQDNQQKEQHHVHDHHKHDHHGHHALFQAIKLEITKPLQRTYFEEWIAKLPKEVIRAKGILEMTESTSIYQFQYASKQVNYKRVDNSTDLTSCLIIIGYNMPIKEIQDSFHKLISSN